MNTYHETTKLRKEGIGANVEPFVVKCVDRGTTLEFFDREPEGPQVPIEHFSVRVTSEDMNAASRVYTYDCPWPGIVALFQDMAKNWAGWVGPKSWATVEDDLKMTCTHDRRGHILIQIQLRTGFRELDWDVRLGVKTEAGQLDFLAREAARFFGSSGGG